MLKIVNRFCDLDIDRILLVYEEQFSGRSKLTKDDFCEDWMLFFRDKHNVCCIWETEATFKACLRIEPYRDGALITCLETAPQDRGPGHATALINAVKDYLKQQNCSAMYVHILENNKVSMHTHRKAGFTKYSDVAHLVDGTISQRYCTLICNLNAPT